MNRVICVVAGVLLCAGIALADGGHNGNGPRRFYCVNDSGENVTVGQVCGDATAACEAAAAAACSQACGDSVQNVTCPEVPTCPDVEVGSRVEFCNKWVVRKNGVAVGKGCRVTTSKY